MSTDRYNLKTETSNPADLHNFVDRYVRKNLFATAKTLEEEFIKHQIATVAGYEKTQMLADLARTKGSYGSKLSKMLNNLGYRGQHALSEYVAVVDVSANRLVNKKFRGQEIKTAAFCTRSLAKRIKIATR